MLTGIHIFSYFISNLIALSPILNNRTFLAIITIRIVIIERNIPVVIHSTEINAFCIVETTVHRRIPVMPFTGMESVISRLLQSLANQCMIIGHSRTLLFQRIEIFTRHQHGTARHTDSAGSSTHNMSIGKDGTFSSQLI